MDPTAAPVDLIIRGKTYKAYPFRDKDHEEYNKWVRREYIRRIKDIIGDDNEMLRQAMLQAVKMVWITGPGKEVAMTVAGIAKMANLLCRTTSFTEQDLASNDALRETVDAFTFLHGIQREGAEEVDDSPPESQEDPSGN